MGNPNVGKSIKAVLLWKAVRVQAGLERTGLLLLASHMCDTMSLLREQGGGGA